MNDTTNDRLTLQHRAYRPDDLDSVVALHERAFAVLAKSHHSPDQIAAHTALVRDPAYAEDLARSHLRLAFQRPGVLAATAGWLRVPGLAPGVPKTARIRKVFVDPRFARRGIAGWMVSDTERRAWKQGCRAFVVRATVNAVPLYEKLGYEATGDATMRTSTGADLPVVLMARTTPPAALAEEPQSLD